jgi:hypothetical protein
MTILSPERKTCREMISVAEGIKLVHLMCHVHVWDQPEHPSCCCGEPHLPVVSTLTFQALASYDPQGHSRVFFKSLLMTLQLI